MGWIQGSTPTISLGIPQGVSLTGYKIYATVEQGEIEITKSGSAVSVKADNSGLYAHIVEFTLTQNETLQFIPGAVKYQLRWINSSGKSGGTDIVEDIVKPSLNTEVIKYG